MDSGWPLRGSNWLWIRRAGAIFTVGAVLAAGGALAGGLLTQGETRPNPPPVAPPPPPPSGGQELHLTNQGYNCTSTINYSLVTIYNPPGNGFTVSAGCAGYIGELEIDTWHDDGIRVQGSHGESNNSQLLTIDDGQIVCHDRDADAHQDGIQTFGDDMHILGSAGDPFIIDCGSSNNGAIYLTASSPQDPQSDNIWCDWCLLKTANTTLNVESSPQTGNNHQVTNTLVCTGRTSASSGTSLLASFAGSTILPQSDPRCIPVATFGNPDHAP